MFWIAQPLCYASTWQMNGIPTHHLSGRQYLSLLSPWDSSGLLHPSLQPNWSNSFPIVFRQTASRLAFLSPSQLTTQLGTVVLSSSVPENILKWRTMQKAEGSFRNAYFTAVCVIVLTKRYPADLKYVLFIRHSMCQQTKRTLISDFIF